MTNLFKKSIKVWLNMLRKLKNKEGCESHILQTNNSLRR